MHLEYIVFLNSDVRHFLFFCSSMNTPNTSRQAVCTRKLCRVMRVQIVHFNCTGHNNHFDETEMKILRFLCQSL